MYFPSLFFVTPPPYHPFSLSSPFSLLYSASPFVYLLFFHPTFTLLRMLFVSRPISISGYFINFLSALIGFYSFLSYCESIPFSLISSPSLSPLPIPIVRRHSPPLSLRLFRPFLTRSSNPDTHQQWPCIIYSQIYILEYLDERIPAFSRLSSLFCLHSVSVVIFMYIKRVLILKWSLVLMVMNDDT